jgi:hypothetical protein
MFDGWVEVGLREERGAGEGEGGPNTIDVCGLAIEGHGVDGGVFVKARIYVYR